MALASAPTTSRTAEQRVEAWTAAIREAGLEELPLMPGGWRGDDGFRAADAVARSRAEGVLAANDLCAMGLIRGLGQLGARVPEDLGVAGIDDWPGGEQFMPPLTTLRLPIAGLCETAVTLVCEQLAGEDARAVVLPAELIVRDSTG